MSLGPINLTQINACWFQTQKLVRLSGTRRNANPLGNGYKLRQGLDLHLLHHIVAVGFDGAFGAANRPSDLLVRFAANDQARRLPARVASIGRLRARTLSSLSFRSRNVLWCAKACSIARKRSSDATGLVRKSSAPALIARTVVGMSGFPVMNMIGSVEPSSASRFCSPGPSRPGICTSRRMQLGMLSAGKLTNKCRAEG